MLRKTIFHSLTILLLIFTLSSFISTGIAQQTSIANSPSISASSAILVDAKSGQVLYEKNVHEQRSIASTTKIMTAIIVLERAKLNEEVTIDNSASEVGESELFLQPGEKMTVQDLLYGLLLHSANDAAVALAEYVAGSVTGFAELMNRKANSIGAKNTHFINPHGLYDANHYSTAYDLALITRYGFKDKMFAEIVATKEHTIPRQGKNAPSKIKNHNKLLWKYPYANGVKTGFIRQAGHCLVSSANRNGIQLISVVLNSPSAEACYNHSQNLLEYGFNEFKLEKVIKKGGIYKKVKLPEIFNEKLSLEASKDLIIQVRKMPGTLKKLIIAKEPKSLPIKKGEKLGEVEVKQFGRNLGKVDLVAAKTISKPGKLEMTILWLKFIFKKLIRNQGVKRKS
jgi:D-alanyl-D-alanine carboxypeptidase (penicillin-binding protein 5/6)